MNNIKEEDLYKIQVYVSQGGKPLTSHPWFSTAGGLLGSTNARVKVKIILSDVLTYSDRNDIEKQLLHLGFNRKMYDIFVLEEILEYTKAHDKLEKEQIKKDYIQYYKERLNPFFKIALEYGNYGAKNNEQ